jgi:hypothetical protein
MIHPKETFTEYLDRMAYLYWNATEFEATTQIRKEDDYWTPEEGASDR